MFLDGSAALEQLSSGERPDLLILDWVMPGISGPEVCRFVRQAAAPLCDLSILLLTAMQNTEQVVEGLQAGANDYLPKPYANAELEARVDSLLKQLMLLERARKAEETARACLSKSPDALISVNAQEQLIYANEEAQILLGEPFERRRGRTLGELLPDVDLPELRASGGNGTPQQRDVRLGDAMLSVRVRVVPMYESTVTTLSLRDVTAQRKAEARRLDFYSMIAHDLRSPLSALLLRTQLISRGQRGPLTPELRRDVQRMEENLRSMMAMINDFLDLARMESGGYRLRKEPVVLDALAEKTVDELLLVSEASRVRLGLKKANTPVTVLGDEQRLGQVLVNLLGNAIKFTPPGGLVTVAIDDEGGHARLSVSDTGPGISPDALPKLFQRYTRAIDAEHEVAGTGLGLLIVREIVEAHGGRVSVRSQVGEGSTFTVELPPATRQAARPSPSTEA